MSTIRERNKELILRAASEEFADKGFAATKTSDIAAKAGLPKPNVYYYFKSKEKSLPRGPGKHYRADPAGLDAVQRRRRAQRCAERLHSLEKSASPVTCLSPPRCSPAKSCTAPRT